MKRYSMGFLLLASTISIAAHAASDTGKIVEVYAHPSGQMALRLDQGLPNSSAANNCGVAGNQWAGVAATDAASIKSAILAAKATGSQVTLVTLSTCIGTWIKIEAMSIN